MSYAALVQRFPRLPDFIALARLNRPIGVWLLLWPTLWAVFLAGSGRPPLHIVVVFALGVLFMRSAGCVINDYADRDFDGHVWRTQARPLATGRIRPREALAFFAVLVGLSALLLPFLNLTTFFWSFGALAIAVAYPFMKRYTFLPQVVLGAAFSWGIPMAFTAQGQEPGLACWLLYGANLCWTVAYDTQYAMADREDDLKVGIKSTAILFGRFDRRIIAALQGVFLLAMVLLGRQSGLGWPYFAALAGAIALFAWQARLTAARQPADCLKAFLHNHWVGMLVFAGLLAGYAMQSVAS